MHQLEPFVREAGTGPGIVCTHSNASTSGQWRGLMDRLAPKFRVLALDSYGSGKSPEWPSDRVIRLRDEVEFLEPVLTRAGSPLSLVGVALDEGNQDAAAERFIDYWMEAGSWEQTPEHRRPPIAASVTSVRRWGHALFTEPTPLTAFRSLDVPIRPRAGAGPTTSETEPTADGAPCKVLAAQVTRTSLRYLFPARLTLSCSVWFGAVGRTVSACYGETTATRKPM